MTANTADFVVGMLGCCLILYSFAAPMARSWHDIDEHMAELRAREEQAINDKSFDARALPMLRTSGDLNVYREGTRICVATCAAIFASPDRTWRLHEDRQRRLQLQMEDAMTHLLLAMLISHGSHRASFTVTCTVLRRVTYAQGKTIVFDGTNAPEPVIKTDAKAGVVEVIF